MENSYERILQQLKQNVLLHQIHFFMGKRKLNHRVGACSIYIKYIYTHTHDERNFSISSKGHLRKKEKNLMTIYLLETLTMTYLRGIDKMSHINFGKCIKKTFACCSM